MISDVFVSLASVYDAVDIAAAEALYIDCPWTVEQVRAEINNRDSVFVVARVGMRFAGYLSGSVAADECEISNVAVMEDLRRRGVATELFAEFEHLVKKRGVTKMFLLVRENNAPAMRLYKKLGFIEVGLRKNYYKEHGAIIMRKDC